MAMRVLFFDCSSGISGDMTVGALLDLGVDPGHLDHELKKLGLDREFHTHVSEQSRQSITGKKFDVHVTQIHGHDESHSRHDHGHHHPHNEPHSHEHGHQHSHHDHSHDHESAHTHGRTHREIRELILQSTLSDFVKSRSLAIFQRIAVAEGRIHGCPPEEVGFHEVGAVDSIVDIVATCVCLESLGSPRIFSSILFDGTGTIDCAHGRFPLPAPATLEILKGVPLRQIDEPLEFLTPTGAAILAEFCETFGPMPSMTTKAIGYGIGSRDTKPRANVLRVVLGDLAGSGLSSYLEPESVMEVVTNIDDMSPELLAVSFNGLINMGALDVFVTPVTMKKNRPGFQLTALCRRRHAAGISNWMFRNTSAFGVRIHECDRMILSREVGAVETPYGRVDVKFGFLKDEMLQASPEFDSCEAVASRCGVPVRDVYTAAVAAANAIQHSRVRKTPEHF